MQKLRIPAWALVAIAAVISVGVDGLWIRPTRVRIAAVEQQLQRASQDARTLENQIMLDRLLPPVSPPVTKAVFEHLWPNVIERAESGGYKFQGATFAAAPPISRVPADARGPSAPGAAVAPGRSAADAVAGASAIETVTAIEIIAKFTGAYLPLDGVLTRMRHALPLWSWRSVAVAAQPGATEVTVTLDGVVPIEDRSVARSAAPRRPTTVSAPFPSVAP